MSTTPQSMEIFTSDSETHALVYDRAMESTLPGLDDIFKSVNDRYSADKLGAFKRLVENRFYINTTYDGLVVSDTHNGVAVEASVICDEDTVNSSEELLIFAPFADTGPMSSPEMITEYTNLKEANFITVDGAKPHSWSQSIKSGIIHDALKAAGRPMRVVTIFGLIPQTAWTREEQKAYTRGDYTPAGQLADLAFRHSQDVLHGPSTSQSGVEAYHLNGLSVGGNFAIGAAADQSTKRNIASVTSQEQPIGHAGIKDTLARFTFKSTVGAKSTKQVPESAVLIPNPAMRAEVDRGKNELDMIAQQIRGMLKLSYLKGFSHSDDAIAHAMVASARGAKLTFAAARNSAMTEHTLRILQDAGILDSHIIIAEALEGQHAAHLINEQVPLSTAIALRGIFRSTRR